MSAFCPPFVAAKRYLPLSKCAPDDRDYLPDGALETVASLGFAFTSGLGLGDTADGERGCTTTGCYITLGVFGLLLLLGIFNQV